MAVLELIILHAEVIPATLFPLLYLRSQWNRHDTGRALMLSSVGLALLVDVSVLGMWIGHLDGWLPDLITLTVLLIIFAGSVYQLTLLIRAQHRARKEN